MNQAEKRSNENQASFAGSSCCSVLITTFFLRRRLHGSVIEITGLPNVGMTLIELVSIFPSAMPYWPATGKNHSHFSSRKVANI